MRAREEAGLEVEAVKLIALYDRQRRGHPLHPEYSYKAFFACRQRDGRMPRPGSETPRRPVLRRDGCRRSRWSGCCPSRSMAFTHHADPGLPTAFDWVVRVYQSRWLQAQLARPYDGGLW